jgi:hypothetical protein
MNKYFEHYLSIAINYLVSSNVYIYLYYSILKIFLRYMLLGLRAIQFVNKHFYL